ncbi:hypothetical protein [Acidocella sp.]|jgi:hypothetical protein|uniref:hypothetical protein n=1 Tax=Acidocella sp. TaxID=50710 RepID=UPI0039B79143
MGRSLLRADLGRDREDRRQAAVQMLADDHGRAANLPVFVYAAGGYYYPGTGTALRQTDGDQ